MAVRTPNTYELIVNVLGYQEDDEWCALALEMDLRGYGNTFEEAFEELDRCIEMQISYALQKGKPEMIFHAADPMFFDLLAKAVMAHRLSESGTATEEGYLFASMPFPPPSVISERNNEFIAQ